MISEQKSLYKNIHIRLVGVCVFVVLLSGLRLFIFINCSHEGKTTTRAVGMKSVTKCYACKRRRQKIHFHADAVVVVVVAVVHVNLLDTPGQDEDRGLGRVYLLPLCEWWTSLPPGHSIIVSFWLRVACNLHVFYLCICKILLLPTHTLAHTRTNDRLPFSFKRFSNFFSH